MSGGVRAETKVRQAMHVRAMDGVRSVAAGRRAREAALAAAVRELRTRDRSGLSR